MVEMKAHRSYFALDALQPINHILARRKAAVPARDIRRCGETLLLRVAALLTDLPHQRGGVIEIGSSPICATPVRPVVAIQLDELVVYWVTVGGGHKIHIA